MIRKISITLLILLALILAGAGAVYYYAAHLAERQAIAFLSQRGFEVESLKVERLDFRGAQIAALKLKKPLKTGVETALIDFNATTFKLTGLYAEPSRDQHFTADVEGSYVLDFNADTLSAEGTAKGVSHPFTTRFTLKQDFSGNTALTLKDAQLEWGGGTVGVPVVSLALPLVKKVPLTLTIRGIALDTLLRQALGTASAEGTVSGEVPVVITPEGNITFGSGVLTASSGGVIRIPPGTFPVSNPELAAVANVLTDFRYTALSITLIPGANDALTVRLTVEGNNPGAYDGREVKLNINLGGDVVKFVQFSLLPTGDPTRWLQEQH